MKQREHIKRKSGQSTHIPCTKLENTQRKLELIESKKIKGAMRYIHT